MKVCLVEECGYDKYYDCQYNTIVKVFTNEVKAEKFVESNSNDEINYRVYEMEVE